MVYFWDEEAVAAFSFAAMLSLGSLPGVVVGFH
jgi:hypothetical protein